jgi:hypothetical protein
VEEHSDISFRVAKLLDDGHYSGTIGHPGYCHTYNGHFAPQKPFIPPRRTKDYWTKHIPKDGKR